jgi:hypothetical protein
MGALERPWAHPTTVRDRTRWTVAIVIGLVGVVWVLQGLGVPIGGSFMVGDMFWAYAGAALMIGALFFAWWPRLRRR